LKKRQQKKKKKKKPSEYAQFKIKILERSEQKKMGSLLLKPKGLLLFTLMAFLQKKKKKEHTRN